MTKKPSFNEISAIEERALLGKLEVARKLITHSPEKGRSLEDEVSAVIRRLLPPEYGVGSGFVVFHGDNGPELSSQLDIIIFDAIKGGPVGHLASCEVYPIENVYGYIEVKTSICVAGPNAKKLPKNSLQECLKQNEKLRRMKKRLFWNPTHGSPARFRLMDENWLSVRGFVFAFEAEGKIAKDPHRLAQSMSDYASKYGAHLHGLLILENAFLSTIAVDASVATSDDYHHVLYTTDSPFTTFKLQLIKALSTFTRPEPNYTLAIESYYELTKNWKECAPSGDPAI